MTLLELLQKGGPIVWVLAGYSVIGVAIILERTLYYLRLGRIPSPLTGAATGTGWDSRMEEELASRRGPEATVVRAMREADRHHRGDPARVGARVRSQLIQRMERGLRTLGILGNTAPLLGLLGTITGMIKAFMVIEQAGGKVDAQALAGGIWEAMITTGVGLAVAIPLLILLHLLEGVVERRANTMGLAASLVLEHRARCTAEGGEEEVPRPHQWEAEGLPHAL